jgi:hypothetical protein
MERGRTMKRTIVINSAEMGIGSGELGSRLIGSFLRKLSVSRHKPDRIVFYNSGVGLLARGSIVLDALSRLLEDGVDLIACGTCVGYYQLSDKIVAGRVSDMQEIVSILIESESVITI